MYTVKEYSLQNKIPYVHVCDIPRLNIYKTFDCGQCFRFDPVSKFGHKYEFGGVAFGKYVVFAQDVDTELFVYGASADDFTSIWASFLSLGEDYDKIDSHIIKTVNGEHALRATEYSSGIRILKQDSWEALCSFIISQNNNIPRIKKIIAQMSEKYGDVVEFDGQSYYTFPSPESLFLAGEAEIFALKTGFRAKYIHDAASKVFGGEISLDKINEFSFEDASAALSKIKGVGPKVASCALLFGFGKTEAFPIDVWIKRSLDNHFGGQLDIGALGKAAGIFQQYLFYYERYNLSVK
jgi:N-glycosylase/DNA lyase